MENESKKTTNYITGIIGATIGGLIAAIPWILIYIYGNMLLSLLAAIIAVGEFYGYKICKGKINNKLPIIIMILAIIIVTVVTFLILPTMMLIKQNVPVSIETITNLYSYSEFTSAMTTDYIVSIIFTILGAGIITSNIKKQLLSNPENVEVSLINNQEQIKFKQDAINIIKPIFEKYNAITKENTMTKEEVISELENKNHKTYFDYLKNLKIIKKVQGRYYYSEENENNKKSYSLFGRILGVIAIVIIIGIAIIAASLSNTNTIENDDVRFLMPNDWSVYQEYNDEDGWTYYKYINNYINANENKEVIDSENSEETTKIDYKKYPSTISVSYDKDVIYNSIDELKESLEEYIKSLEPEEYNIDTLETKTGNTAIKVKVKFTSYPEEIDYWCYIYNEEKLGYISSRTFNMEDDEQIEKTTMEILNSFEWKN